MRFRTLLLLALTCLPSLEAAAGSQTGTITNLYLRDSDGLVFLFVSGAPSSRPACAASTVYWIIPNENSDSGKRMYAALLAARMSGRVVAITGKNTCTRWGDGEDIELVNVH